jgi:hypothetical protein
VGDDPVAPDPAPAPRALPRPARARGAGRDAGHRRRVRAQGHPLLRGRPGAAPRPPARTSRCASSRRGASISRP